VGFCGVLQRDDEFGFGGLFNGVFYFFKTADELGGLVAGFGVWGVEEMNSGFIDEGKKVGLVTELVTEGYVVNNDLIILVIIMAHGVWLD
jgi:hypothetical protein